MTEKEGLSLGDRYRDAVLARTGLKPQELVCPREKSDMTPCVARDGGLAVCFNSNENPLCVGCEAFLPQLMEKETSR